MLQSNPMWFASQPISPPKPPFHPRQFERCAVVENFGDQLMIEFGEETDS